MPDAPNHPVAQQADDKLAAEYDREGDTKPSNAYLERPATLSLLPDIEGTRVLDTGCGAGHLAEELSDRGAPLSVSTRVEKCSRTHEDEQPTPTSFRPTSEVGSRSL